jgi:hypothetical protein
MNKIKQWVLNRPFVKAEMLKIRDELSQIVPDEIEEEADNKLNKLLSTVDTNKIVTIDKNHGIVYIGGVKADEGQLTNLKAEAEALMRFDLWHLLYETPKELAQRTMFVHSESLDDLKKGKSMLYLLDSQKKIIDIFLSYQQKIGLTDKK